MKDYFDSTVFITALIVLFGSIVHATNQFKLARKTDRPFNWVDYMVLIPISVFAGGVFAMSATLISNEPIHWFISGGMGSFMGVAGLNGLGQKVLQFLIHSRANEKDS